jgi:hypothetical protein
MHASSKPAPLVRTSLVKMRRNTTRPEMSVNARTIVLTRVPAGVEISRFNIVAIAGGKKTVVYGKKSQLFTVMAPSQKCGEKGG